MGTIKDEAHDASAALLARIEQAEEARRDAQMSLPIWEDAKRATPLAFVECALFSAAPLRSRQFLESVQIDSSEQHSVTYTGVRLTQYDADVWRGIMHLARGAERDSVVRFTARELLRLIGRDTGGAPRRQLVRSLRRLQATSVSIFDHRAKSRYFGSLLPAGAESEIDDKDSDFIVLLPTTLVRFFADGTRQIAWEPRKRLQKKPLALWLQVFFSDRAEPPALPVEELKRLSGSDVKGLRFFRRALRTALEELEDVDVLARWKIDKQDRVHVELMTPERLALKRAKQQAGAKEQTSLPLSFVLSAETRATFEELHAPAHFDQCFRDWDAWLGKAGRREDTHHPDAAFLGFARKWKPPAER